MTRVVSRGDGVNHLVMEEYTSYLEKYGPIVTACQRHIHVYWVDNDNDNDGIVTCIACIAAKPIERYP